MSEKDIKTKPKQSPKSKGSPNMPKVAVKSKDIQNFKKQIQKLRKKLKMLLIQLPIQFIIRARLLRKIKSKSTDRRLKHGKMKHLKIRNLHRENPKLLTKSQRRLRMNLKRTKTPLKRRKTIMPTNNLQEMIEP